MKLPVKGEIIRIKGEELQVSYLELVDTPLSVGEDEYLFHAINRHGEYRVVSETEIIESRKGNK